MKRLEIRLLGGFEARLDERVVQSFESQKARGLLAYLALHRDQPQRRDHLAGLLWSDRAEDSARRNLRQAIYNVKTALAESASQDPIFTNDGLGISINPSVECWVDVEAFREEAALGLSPGGPDPYHLATAAQLYRGDLLAGFLVRGGPMFEDWLLAEQEQLREEAIEVFRTLITAYLGRGEFRFGIRYAKTLLAIDPLSEETHRELIKLYHLAGRRSRALAQYERLRNVLNAELGVEPLEETQDLYREILLEEGSPEAPEVEPVGPMIPLVGRGDAFTELNELWGNVLAGEGRLTVVRGEAGCGKSRLVKSFVDAATSRRRALVLRGRSYPAAAEVPYQPLIEVVMSIFADILPDDPELAPRLSSEVLADLPILAPQLRELDPALTEGLIQDTAQGDSRRLASSFHDMLTSLARDDSGAPLPVILLLDDLHLADTASVSLLADLLPNCATQPVWLLATSGEAGSPSLDRLETQADTAGQLDRVPVGRLTFESVEELAQSLVDLESAAKLASFLWNYSGGLPIIVAELINYLWDESVLIPVGPGHWRLDSDPETLSPPSEISALINLRIQRLPTSARRLLALAAIIGHQFDAKLLQDAGTEHLAVVETCLELALERWLVRQFPRSWSQVGSHRDIVLWAKGARRGAFEFAHGAVRTSILENINPLRRQVMHREVAAALEENGRRTPELICEAMAHHALQAAALDEALPWIVRAAKKSARCGAEVVSSSYSRRGRQILDRIDPDNEQSELRRELEEMSAAVVEER